MKHKTLSLLLLILISTIGIYAQTAVVPSVGDGSIDSPYEIATWQNLYWISALNDVVGPPYYQARMGYHYIQTADIDFADASPNLNTWFDGKGWRPLGTHSGTAALNYPFSGSYNGNGYSISNLYINWNTQDGLGLFGKVNSTHKIQNLKVLNADVRGTTLSISILVGELSAGTVENCQVSVSPSGLLRGGGNVGGVVGQIPNIASPIAPRQIIRCSADVTIEISGTGSGGGLCGSVVNGLIKESYATGTLTLLNSNNASQYLGGLVGGVSNSSNVLDSYSRVNLIKNAGTAVNLGGFAGANINSKIQRCYSTGTVRDDSDNPVGTNNGFVAYLWATDANYKMLNNFWDTQSSGISGTVSNTNNSSEAPQGRNTHQMNSMKTYTDKSWDFRGETTNGTDYTWNMGNGRNNNYPYLNWQHLSDPDPAVTAAINPSPADGATSVLTNAQLSWETGIIAAPWGYKINFGTDTPPTNILQNHDNGTALTYNPGELDLDQTYYWQIVPYNALDAEGCLIWSFTTVDVAPPGIPVALASTDNTANSFKANWNAAANTDGYYLDVAIDTNFTMFLDGYNNRNVLNVTSFEVTGLPNGVGVLYRVRAYNSAGSSANSNSITAYSLAEAPTLSSPANDVTLVDETGNMVGFLPEHQFASSFKLWLGTNTPPTNVYNGHTVAALPFGSMYYFANPLSGMNLSPGTTYYWRAEAVNPGGAGPSSPTWSFTTSGSAAPGNATLVSPSNGADAVSVNGTLSWNAPATGPAPTGYRIYLGQDNPPLSYDTVETASGFQYNALQYNRTYYWQALPYNGSNFAAEQAVWSFTTVDYYQASLDPVDPGTGVITPEILFPDLDGTFPAPTITTAWAPVAITLPNVGLYIGLSGGSTMFGRKIVINPDLGFIPVQIAWRILPNASWNLETRVIAGDPWTANYVYFNLPPAKADGDVEIVFPESENQTLPVTLSTFNAVYSTGQFVSLQWVVQSETAHAGYNILRSEHNNLGSAYRINPALITQGNAQGSQISYSYRDHEVYPNSAYYYWLESLSIYGTAEYYGSIMVSTAGDYDPGTPQIPVTTGLISVYPNPFNPDVFIDYGLKENTPVTLRIYNTRGQLIRSFEDISSQAGTYRLLWDGRDQSGQSCVSGIYYVRMRAGKEVFARKVTLMK